MPRIPGPLDAVQANVTNRRRVVPVAANDSGNRITAASEAVLNVLNTARDQQIENEVASTEMRMRGQLDELRTEIENAPAPEGGGEVDLEGMWDERAQRVRETNLEGLTSPRARRVMGTRADTLLAQGRSGVTQLAQRRVVEGARAGLIQTVAQAQTVLTNENSTPEARATAMTEIETLVNRGVARRTLAADDGARMIAAARVAAAEFEQREGMRARAQTEEDRIWEESGGDLNTALEMARDIDDPALRDMTEDRVAVRASREHTGRESAVRDAMGRAYAAIEQGGSVESLNRADRDIITQAGMMDTLRTYARNRAGGGTGGEGWTAMTRQSQLVRDSLMGIAGDPNRARVFARINIFEPLDAADANAIGVPEGTRLAATLTPEDQNAITLRQRQLRGEAPVSGEQTLVDQGFNRTVAVARRMASAIAPELNVTFEGQGSTAVNSAGDRSRAQAAQLRQQRAQFESYIRNEVQAYVQTNNRLPTDADMERIGRDALRESTRTTRGPLPFDDRTERFRRFQAGPDVNVRVPFSNIPQWQVERLSRAWAQAGHSEPPTPAQIEEMYMRELAGRNE